MLSADEWTASRMIADRYRSDRIFVAGDACHLNLPFGDYGTNMGVGDAVDLGWKLAAGPINTWRRVATNGPCRRRRFCGK
ncbi:MAG: FAD-dependent monooxygenase [Burkholderiales bacterium]